MALLQASFLLLQFLSLLCGLSSALLGSPSFVRRFTTDLTSYYPQIIELPDGDIMFGHETYFTTPTAGTDIVLHRLNSTGQVKWSKRFGSDDINYLNEMVLGSDGSIGVLGKAKYDATNAGLHFAKVSLDGAILLSKVYHFNVIYTFQMKMS